MSRDDQQLLAVLVGAAESKQALDLKVLDISKSASLVDLLVVCGGETEPHLRAIAREIDARLREHGIKSNKWEGVPSSGWLILDLGPVVVHVLRTEEREYYRLEDLWGKEAIVYHY